MMKSANNFFLTSFSIYLLVLHFFNFPIHENLSLSFLGNSLALFFFFFLGEREHQAQRERDKLTSR